MSLPSSIVSSAPPSLSPPLLSVVVPLFDCLSLTRAMLATLQATLPTTVSHEIILVDDGSTDGTREWLAAQRNDTIRVILNERNLGYAHANNRGVAAARGTLLALLNNDLVLLPGWLEPMLAAHAALGRRAGAIGNVQIDAQSGAIDHAGIVINVQGKPVHARALPWWRHRWSPPFREVPAVTGACLLIARELWHQLGGFDAAYVNGGEDVDLCFRARAAGRVNGVALRSVVRHHVSASTGRKRRDEENSYRLARTWGREFLLASQDATYEWSHAHLSAALREPQARDYVTTLRALAYALHLRRSPPPEAVRAIVAGQALEFERWRSLFG
jgi:O-antigen biosynthesis protein